jgi:hypothetical protein
MHPCDCGGETKYWGAEGWIEAWAGEAELNGVPAFILHVFLQ